jgi:hypothetical protein
MGSSDMKFGKGTGEEMQSKTGGRWWSLARVLRLVPLLLLMGSSITDTCRKECAAAVAWEDIESFTLSGSSSGEGEGALKLVWGCPGDFNTLVRYELVSQEKSGSKTSEIGRTETSILWSVPSTNLVLRAYYDQDGKKGFVPSLPVNLPSVVTPSLTLYGLSDTTKPNGLAFNSDWSARGVTFAERGQVAVWFVVKDSGDKLWLVAPDLIGNGREWGERSNRSVAVAEDFDDLSQCPKPSEAPWSRTTELEVGKTYAIWLSFSAGPDGKWIMTDHFGKLKVLAIDGKAVTFELAVQPTSGLRWVLTP